MVRIGVVGTGGIAAGHAQLLQAIEDVEVTACCDILPEKVAAFAKTHKIARSYTDYREMLQHENLDAVTNCTHDAVHAEVSIAVMEKGLGILCEKPMATNLKDARKMTEVARKTGVPNMVNYSKRNSSALQHAAERIAAGDLGRIIHAEASYLQSWLTQPEWQTAPRLLWRLSTKHGSQGVLGDLGCHIYDLIAFLCGDLAEIDCRLETFDKGVMDNRIDDYVFDANDSFASIVKFRNGALGVVHSSRWVSCHSNREFAKVYGTDGSIEIDFEQDKDSYRYFDGKSRTWTTVKCEPTLNNWERFVRWLKTGTPDPSDFDNGLKVQAYLHYSVESARESRPLRISF